MDEYSPRAGEWSNTSVAALRSAGVEGPLLAELEAWLAGEGEVPSSWPGFEVLAPALPRKGRHGAILLPLQALRAAIVEAR